MDESDQECNGEDCLGWNFPVSDIGLLVSWDAWRDPSEPLDGLTVSDDIFIFIPDVPGIVGVRYYLDEGPYLTLTQAPWDLVEGGQPLSTWNLDDGWHSIRVEVDLSGRTHTTNASFQVENNSGATAINLVYQAYIGYYGRCPDEDGFDYWYARIGGDGGWQDLDAIIAAFGTSQEYTSRFDGYSDVDLINNLYLNMFDRYAEADGLAFYLSLLDIRRKDWRNTRGGSDDGATEYALSRIALDILNGAQGGDVTVLSEKINACPTYSDRDESDDYDQDDDSVEESGENSFTAHAISTRYVEDDHKDDWSRRPDDCLACHGADFRGTAASATFAARVWPSDDRQPDGSKLKRYDKGDLVGCMDCHRAPGSDDDDDDDHDDDNTPR